MPYMTFLKSNSVVIIREVVIESSKMAKTSFNFNRQVEEFEQKPIETTSISDKQKEITNKRCYYYLLLKQKFLQKL